MAATHTPRPLVLAVLVSLAGALVAAVLGLLTFGAQATAHPDRVPLGVVAPPGSPVAAQLAGQGGDAVSWRAATAQEAANLLEDKEIYGYLDLSGAPSAARIVVSGAVNPQGAQIAQQILTDVTHRLAAAAGGPTVETVTLHPASAAGRTVPLAASALLWISGLVATLAFGLLTTRRGIRAGIGPRSIVALSASVFGVAVIVGLFALWDNTIPLTWGVLGFLGLTALAFTVIQGALLRLLHLRAAAILAPLYLIAPAVAGQVPEMLDPAYRALLWSWTPFRFSTEGLRGLLQGSADAPDVRTGIIVLAAMAVAGLAVMIVSGSRVPPRPSAPANPAASSLGARAVSDGSLRKLRSRTSQKAQPDPADGVVSVGVDEADGLPGAQREPPAEHRNGGIRR
jgi:hypothetical protein